MKTPMKSKEAQKKCSAEWAKYCNLRLSRGMYELRKHPLDPNRRLDGSPKPPRRATAD